MEFKHISVLLTEAVNGLNIQTDGIYADGTMGGGGHSLAIAQRLSGSGILLGIDRDTEALKASRERLKEFSNVRFIHNNFTNIKQILETEQISALDGAVIDLGVSSYQLDNKARGFSYMEDAPLDMRMDQESEFSAYNVVNEYSKEQLTKIFYDYGEERFSPRIADIIIEKRQQAPVQTTLELVEIIRNAIPDRFQKKGSHPAKRVFQAIRIEVNGELEPLRNAITDFFDVLRPGGRLCIITFHSLEDRIVKQTFASFATGCTCPKEFPICICGKKPVGKVITNKPIIPGATELAGNKRSKSAKLRIVEKL